MLNRYLYLVAKTLKQRKCPQTGDWIKEMWHIDGFLFHLQKQRNSIVCDRAAEPGRHHAKLEKPRAERQTLHDLMSMWAL